jgi:hypothetical protein
MNLIWMMWMTNLVVLIMIWGVSIRQSGGVFAADELPTFEK